MNYPPDYPGRQQCLYRALSQEPWTWLAMAKQEPSDHDDADDPGGNERMAKTSVSFAGQLRGPALAGGE